MSDVLYGGLIVFYIVFVVVLLLIWHYYKVFSGKKNCSGCSGKCELKDKGGECPGKKGADGETKQC